MRRDSWYRRWWSAGSGCCWPVLLYRRRSPRSALSLRRYRPWLLPHVCRIFDCKLGNCRIPSNLYSLRSDWRPHKWSTHLHPDSKKDGKSRFGYGLSQERYWIWRSRRVTTWLRRRYYFSWRSRAIDLMRSGLPVQPCSVCLSKLRLYSETKDWSAHNHP